MGMDRCQTHFTMLQDDACQYSCFLINMHLSTQEFDNPEGLPLASIAQRATPMLTGGRGGVRHGGLNTWLWLDNDLRSPKQAIALP